MCAVSFILGHAYSSTHECWKWKQMKTPRRLPEELVRIEYDFCDFQMRFPKMFWQTFYDKIEYLLTSLNELCNIKKEHLVVADCSRTCWFIVIRLLFQDTLVHGFVILCTCFSFNVVCFSIPVMHSELTTTCISTIRLMIQQSFVYVRIYTVSTARWKSKRKHGKEEEGVKREEHSSGYRSAVT